MKILVEIDSNVVKDDLLEKFDRWVESSGNYYHTPAGSGKVTPEIVVPGAADDDFLHRLGYSEGGPWRVWTRSSGTVVAITHDGSRLLAAGRRHSVAEIIGTVIPGYWKNGDVRPQFTAGTWYLSPEPTTQDEPVAYAVWLESQTPNHDPLRPTT